MAQAPPPPAQPASPRAEGPAETLLAELTRAAGGADQIARGAERAHHEVGAILDDPVGRRAIQLLTESPRCFVQIMRRKQYATALQSASVTQSAQRFDRGGSAAFHVRGAAASQPVSLDPRRDERQVHRVEVAIELQCPPRFAAAETHHNGGRGGVTGRYSIHCEAIRGQDFHKTFRDHTAFPRPTRHRDQPLGRVEQPGTVDRASQTFAIE